MASTKRILDLLNTDHIIKDSKDAIIIDNFKQNIVFSNVEFHYNDKKRDKGIYGNATTKEAKELEEEGIDTEIVPWVNENEN